MTTESSGNELSEIVYWLGGLNGNRNALVYISGFWSKTPRLSSFFDWLLRNPFLNAYIRENPVKAVRPKAPRAYQNGSTKSLNDKQGNALLETLKLSADAGDLVAKRDYAILLFFVMTGLRRNEVIGLKGKDLEFKDDRFLAR